MMISSVDIKSRHHSRHSLLDMTQPSGAGCQRYLCSAMMQSVGPDPFESSSTGLPLPGDADDAATTGQGAVPDARRETLVTQAVKFLSDPRVQAADPRRAVDFLLAKKLTESEIRAAFDRLSLPYPSAGSRGLLNGHHAATGPNVVMLPPGAQLHVGSPRRQGSTWRRLMWNATIAAGIFAAVRAIFRRYIVPTYFPGFQFVGDGRQPRQIEQIDELRDAVRQLAVSTQETNERVERLSITLSSTGALDDDSGISSGQKPQLPIGRTSRSLTVSRGIASSNGGSEGSRGVLERLDELREEVNSLKLLSSGQKQPASATHAHSRELSFENVDEFYTPQQNPRPVSTAKGANEGRLYFGGSSEKSRRSVSFHGEKEGAAETDSGDDFMSMKPASVEDSWSSDALIGAKSRMEPVVPEATAGSESGEGKVSEAQDASPAESHSVTRDWDTPGSDAEERSSSAAENLEPAAEPEIANSPDACSAGAESSGADSPLRRFRETMLAEAELVASRQTSASNATNSSGYADAAVGMDFGLGDFGTPSKRLSTASAPAPDTALSDVD